jgi:hypothetical protein
MRQVAHIQECASQARLREEEAGGIGTHRSEGLGSCDREWERRVGVRRIPMRAHRPDRPSGRAGWDILFARGFGVDSTLPAKNVFFC